MLSEQAIYSGEYTSKLENRNLSILIKALKGCYLCCLFGFMENLSLEEELRTHMDSLEVNRARPDYTAPGSFY